jgi:hypothetical protein
MSASVGGGCGFQTDMLTPGISKGSHDPIRKPEQLGSQGMTNRVSTELHRYEHVQVHEHSRHMYSLVTKYFPKRLE